MRVDDLSSFKEPGLYLLFPDGSRLDLTHDIIEERVRAMLDDPDAIPQQVRAAADYEACDICPQRDTAEICHAIMPLLSFAQDLDRYMSYDSVTAMYRHPGQAGLHMRNTVMQEALQYIAILSMMYYCEVGRGYYRYFEDVDPLIPPASIAREVFRNMYLACHGNLDELRETLSRMQEEILHVAECQVRRLRLGSRRDALVNAVVITENTIAFTMMELRRQLDAFRSTEAPGP